MAIAYVALGSNLGDKKKNLQRALMLLMQQGVEVLQVSGLFCYGALRCDGPAAVFECCVQGAH